MIAIRRSALFASKYCELSGLGLKWLFFSDTASEVRREVRASMIDLACFEVLTTVRESMDEVQWKARQRDGA